MDGDDEIWVPKDESDSEDDQTWDPEDPTFFHLGLAPKGDPSEYRVRRGGDQRPRAALSTVDSSSKFRPAFNVSAAAKLIVHGTIDRERRQRATLLVHEFTFLAHSSGRFTEASIQLKFKSVSGRPDGPLVKGMAPSGVHEMSAVSRRGHGRPSATLRGGGGGARVEGAQPFDEWGHSVEAKWKLKEESQSGIPKHVRTCVLLRRDSDQCFALVPIIKATPDLKTPKELSTRNLDGKPMVYDPEYEPFDELEENSGIDRWNLGSLNLDTIWGWDYVKI